MADESKSESESEFDELEGAGPEPLFIRQEKDHALPPTTEVHRLNLYPLLSSILAIIKSAQFIALDTEFTGLGEPRKIRAKNMEERYANMRQLVDSHAIVAFGISVFSDKNFVPGKQQTLHECKNYRVFNFNFTLLRETDFTVSPQSLMFLVDTGFDFNYQLRVGIPYHLAGTKKANAGDYVSSLRDIFKAILKSKRPTVVHNGLLDMMFLYHSFYAPLPNSLDVFLADLSDMFVGGLYDTKYIADFHTREQASFLSYLFRKYDRQRRRNPSLFEVDVSPEINLPAAAMTVTQIAPLTVKQRAICGDKDFCICYAQHGFCKLGRRCCKSHDLDLILDHEEISKKSRKRRKTDQQPTEKVKEATSADPIPVLITKPDAFHAAGYDAFMTAFTFAYQLSQAKLEDVEQYHNKLYVISKDFPLLVRQGLLTATSQAHRELKAQDS